MILTHLQLKATKGLFCMKAFDSVKGLTFDYNVFCQNLKILWKILYKNSYKGWSKSNVTHCTAYNTGDVFY